MKAKIINFRKNNSGFKDDTVESVIKGFLTIGIETDSVITLSVNDAAGFKREFNYLKDSVETVVVIDDKNVTFKIKKIIADCMKTVLIENSTAVKLVKEYEAGSGKICSQDLFELPEAAIVLPNAIGPYQGFMIEENDFNLVVLPSDKDEATSILNTYVLPYFEKKSNRIKEISFKIFGVSESEIQNVISDINEKVSAEINFDYFSEHEDVSLTVYCFDSGIEKFDEALRMIVERFNSKIYAEENVSLNKRLFDILLLKKLKIAVAESFTSGRVTSSIISVPGASKVLYEGVVAYSNEAKMKRLGVKQSTLNTYGAVSKQTAYEMAVGLLGNKEVDVAIATTGIAGPSSDGTSKPVGLCYIAAGTRDGVKIIERNFNGSREEITETAKNTALFLAIQMSKKF